METETCHRSDRQPGFTRHLLILACCLFLWGGGGGSVCCFNLVTIISAPSLWSNRAKCITIWQCRKALSVRVRRGHLLVCHHSGCGVINLDTKESDQRLISFTFNGWHKHSPITGQVTLSFVCDTSCDYWSFHIQWGVVLLFTVLYLWQGLILLMSSDGICCMRFFWRRKTLKTRILVSSQAVLHANNATIGTQNKENNKISEIKGIQKEIQDHYFATLKKRREKEGELSGKFISWTQCKKHQSKSSYTNYTRPIKSASHHQRWAKLASQQASDAARDQSNKVGSPPNQIHIIQKKGGRGGRENNRERTEI